MEYIYSHDTVDAAHANKYWAVKMVLATFDVRTSTDSTLLKQFKISCRQKIESSWISSPFNKSFK